MRLLPTNAQMAKWLPGRKPTPRTQPHALTLQKQSATLPSKRNTPEYFRKSFFCNASVVSSSLAATAMILKSPPLIAHGIDLAITFPNPALAAFVLGGVASTACAGRMGFSFAMWAFTSMGYVGAEKTNQDEQIIANTEVVESHSTAVGDDDSFVTEEAPENFHELREKVFIADFSAKEKDVEVSVQQAPEITAPANGNKLEPIRVQVPKEEAFEPIVYDSNHPNISGYKIRRIISKGDLTWVVEGRKADGQYVMIKIPSRSPNKTLMTSDKSAAMRRILVDREIHFIERIHAAVAPEESRRFAKLADTGTTVNGEPYLATEKIKITVHTGRNTIEQRQDLLQYLVEEAKRHPTRPDIIRIMLTQSMIQALQAVAILHEHGMVHGDLKRSQFMMNGDDQENMPDDLFARIPGLPQTLPLPVLIDFQLASATDNPLLAIMRQYNITLITPDFAAPEQKITTQSPTVQTDIYSLGLMLNKMIEEVLVKTIDSQDSIEINKLHQLRMVVAHATAEDPAKRYQSILHMMIDLVAIRDEQELVHAIIEPDAEELHSFDLFGNDDE